MHREKAQGIIMGLIFVAFAVLFGAITLWGIFNLNVVVATLGSIAEGAWMFAGRHII